MSTPRVATFTETTTENSTNKNKSPRALASILAESVNTWLEQEGDGIEIIGNVDVSQVSFGNLGNMSMTMTVTYHKE